MDVPAYMVGVGTLVAGVAGALALIVRRGEDDRVFWRQKYDEEHAKLEACEEALAEIPPRTASKRRKP